VSGGRRAWAEVVNARGTFRVQQWSESESRAPLGDVTLVVDGSRAMQPHMKELAGAIRRAGRPLRIVMAAAEGVRVFQGAASEAGDWLARQPTDGGQDNLPALERARDLAPKDKPAAIIWIHGPQPVAIGSLEPLRQALERGAGARVLDLQIANGPNRLLEDDGLPNVEVIRPAGGLAEELASLLSQSPGPRTALRRKRIPQGVLAEGERAPAQLAGLFAHDETLALLAEGSDASRREAGALAAAFRLVTPVTGAVALETDLQYREAGLEPGGGSFTGESVPEPLFLWPLAGLAVVIFVRRLRADRRGQPANGSSTPKAGRAGPAQGNKVPERVFPKIQV
jgi:hypothetical protein